MKKTLVAIAALGYFGACVLLVAGLEQEAHGKALRRLGLTV